MKIRNMTVVLVFAALAFSSCKNQESKDASTETEKMEVETETNIPVSENENENLELVAKVKDYITTKYLTEADLRGISEEQRKFQMQQIDLNNDGKKEVFVNFNTSYFCGTGGCSLLLLSDQLEPITKFTVMQTPLYVEKSDENGWSTILTQSEGKWRKLSYKNGSYPSNPSVAEISNDAPTDAADVLFKDDNTNLNTYTF